MDFDGSYYRLTISVGKNGVINTVYNVGKIKEVEHPDVAQRPKPHSFSAEDELISTSNDIIPNSTEKSNTKSTTIFTQCSNRKRDIIKLTS